MKIQSILLRAAQMKASYRTLKRFITNVWVFRRELANDTGNDYTDALAFFKRSLERQIPNAISYDQDCSPYYEVINSIDRIINPPYNYDHIYVKYNIDNLPFKFDGNRVISPADSLDPKTREQFDRDILNYCDYEENVQVADVERFTELLKKHLRSLWV